MASSLPARRILCLTETARHTDRCGAVLPMPGQTKSQMRIHMHRPAQEDDAVQDRALYGPGLHGGEGD